MQYFRDRNILEALLPITTIVVLACNKRSLHFIGRCTSLKILTIKFGGERVGQSHLGSEPSQKVDKFEMAMQYFTLYKAQQEWMYRCVCTLLKEAV